MVPEADGARAHRELDRLAAVAAGADGVQVFGRELVRAGDRSDEAARAHVVRVLTEVAVHSLVRVGNKVPEIVILFGLARWTARKSRKYHYFTRNPS